MRWVRESGYRARTSGHPGVPEILGRRVLNGTEKVHEAQVRE